MAEFTPLRDKPGPAEVFLTKGTIEVTGRAYFEDETDMELDVTSVSMRGAQREMTAWLISLGYEPAGRWRQETGEDEGEETSRVFKAPKR